MDGLPEPGGQAPTRVTERAHYSPVSARPRTRVPMLYSSIRSTGTSQPSPRTVPYLILPSGHQQTARDTAWTALDNAVARFGRTPNHKTQSIRVHAARVFFCFFFGMVFGGHSGPGFRFVLGFTKGEGRLCSAPHKCKVFLLLLYTGNSSHSVLPFPLPP